ncbi:hypothetical protein [Halomicrococcus sp. NG-SE-24]|uniref:hypothetical protein n=1 Tax=Halomicrococcus sp. NG-SE-24 TaxID=3436928 RepID=UPI003D95A0EA
MTSLVMRIATKIWDSGWGAIFLTIYTLIGIHLVFPKNHVYKSFVVLPTILVMFLAEQYSTILVDFWAGGELKRATEYIHAFTGEDHFYHAANEDIQTSVDDFDRRAYQNNISILTGFIIAVTAPILGFYIRNLIGAVIGCVVAILALQWLCRRSIDQMNTLARDIVEPYKAKYENQ